MRKHKIAIQGTEASFHHLAAQRLFGEEILIDQCNSFETVCQRVLNNEVDYGVMAIENLLTGCILTNYHLIDKYQLNIIGEITLPIELHLIGMWTASEQSITKVISHPIALAQCNKLLAENAWETGQLADTATSAAYVSQQRSTRLAAISNRETADLHGLTILKEDVQDIAGNETRFIVLSRKAVRNELANKATLSFRLPDAAGALSDALITIQRHGVNLTKIQSIPIATQKDQYAFILELEWPTHVQIDKTLNALKDQVNTLKTLGIYIKKRTSFLIL